MPAATAGRPAPERARAAGFLRGPGSRRAAALPPPTSALATAAALDNPLLTSSNTAGGTPVVSVAVLAACCWPSCSERDSFAVVAPARAARRRGDRRPPTPRDEVAGAGDAGDARLRHGRGDRSRAHRLVLRRRGRRRHPGSHHQRVERPADAALLGVQQLSAAVDQVLSTAGGVVAATGGDPRRFVAVLGPDVDSSPTLAGIALVEARLWDSVRVVTSVGDTTLLTGRPSAALAADVSQRLIAHRRGRSTYDLGSRRVFPAVGRCSCRSRCRRRRAWARSFVLTAGAARGADVVLGNADVARRG